MPFDVWTALSLKLVESMARSEHRRYLAFFEGFCPRWPRAIERALGCLWMKSTLAEPFEALEIFIYSSKISECLFVFKVGIFLEFLKPLIFGIWVLTFSSLWVPTYSLFPSWVLIFRLKVLTISLTKELFPLSNLWSECPVFLSILLDGIEVFAFSL